MEANEIRVGNWLNDPRPLTEFNKKNTNNPDNGYFRATARDIQYAEEFEPIPLTEEILLKCKFEKEIKLYKQTYMSYQFNGYRIIKNNDSTFSLLIVGSSCVLSKIKYLHKLQNIIFDLENIELEINL